MDNGLITFFEIEECGFYRSQKLGGDSKKRSSVHVKGDLNETLDKVTGWAKTRDFCETLPFDSASHPNRPHVYFKDCEISEKNGDHLIVFCRAFSNDEGKLSGFVQDAKVGSASGDVIQVEKNAKGKKLIYGAPMYFWYIPENKKCPTYRNSPLLVTNPKHQNVNIGASVLPIGSVHRQTPTS